MTKKWFCILLAVVILAGAAGVVTAAFNNNGSEVPPVDKVSFSLNGADYPLNPALQDFIDRGWKRGKTLEQTGSYTDEDGPSNILPTGYRLTRSGDQISIYLNVDDCRNGLDPNACRVRSLSIYGKNVESFCLNGADLSQISSEEALELLGEPYKTETGDSGVIYYYSAPEQGISELSLAFPGASDAVSQIFVVFENQT